MKEITAVKCVTSNTTHAHAYSVAVILCPPSALPLSTYNSAVCWDKKLQALTKCEQIFSCACLAVFVCVHSILKCANFGALAANTFCLCAMCSGVERVLH